MILVFYALRRELGGLRKRIGGRAALGEGLRGFRGRIGTQEIAFVATGIGIAQARESACRALQMLPRPRMVISTGVAGALAPELKAGDLVIADRLLLQSGEDGAAHEVVDAAPAVVQAASDVLSRAGLRPAVGPMLTVPRVLASASAKTEAYRRSGALAVEMESAAIAIEAARRGVSCVCVRAVIDEARDEVPGADLADESGHVAPFKAAAYFLKNPSALAQVPAILKNLKLATVSIASALEALCADRRD